MATPLIQSALVTGEVSPSLFGHTDLARMKTAASTMRNMFVSFRGGSYSRAGTAYVGFSKQTGRTMPPRLLPFQFNINQGLALEFGNFYMRVIFDGAFVTETPFPITAITQDSTAVVTATPSVGGVSATANLGAVSSDYNPGDTITVDGGTFVTAAVMTVTDTAIAALSLNSPGTHGYAPGDTINLDGGVQKVKASLQVATTKMISVSIQGGGEYSAGGTVVVDGHGGTGRKYRLSCTATFIGIGIFTITSIDSIVDVGSYTVNPNVSPIGDSSNIISGGGGQLFPASFFVNMGIETFVTSNGGSFSANAPGGTFTQLATSGNGVGATFNAALFGPNNLTFSTPGNYSVTPANPASQSATSGTGAGATYNIVWSTPAVLADDDWLAFSDIVGMPALNGQTFRIAAVGGGHFEIFDVYGNPIDTTGTGPFVSGTAARIYTLPTIYAEQDLRWLKITESADALSVCCVNQESLAEYPPQDLSRIADDNWVFTPSVPAPTVSPPQGPTGTPSAAGTVDYSYRVTAVSPVDGSESIASARADVASGVDIASTAGTIKIDWSPVAGVNQYNVYKATPGYASTPVPAGSLFGFAGSAYGTEFLDSNIVADLSQVPPLHKNPFARGQVTGAIPITAGSAYAAPVVTINSSTGNGAILEPVVVGGAIVAYILVDGGQNYLPTDTITITDGAGSGAAASLSVGPQTGTYPGTVSYFQQRRAYGYTLNNPDTYFMSQPGSFTNFDSRIPTIDTDAVIGSPWSVQVNGIQFMVQTAGGLLVFTGLQNWLIVGAGSFATNVQAISPSSQLANPQPEIGCSATLPPIKINYDVIFVNSIGSFYYDQPYQLYALSEPIDLTNYSSHLFIGFSAVEHAWCAQPYKIIWSVRNDGVLLSLTWLKQQEVQGWARHDTNGLFKSVCSVTEPPVDSLYLAVERMIGSNLAYVIERMDDRIWRTVEDVWAVDCGFSLPQPQPDAVLSADSATGLGAITGVTGLVGGAAYGSATTAAVVDDNGKGPGTGAIPALTIVAGVITAVSFAGNEGAGYIFPKLVVTDPSGQGSGADATLILDNSANFSASANVFASGDVGSVIRMGGGIATITTFTDAQHVTADISYPIVDVLPNSGGQVVPATAGNWSMTAPISTVFGLNPLIGATVTGLADGNVITPRVVQSDGSITLDAPASQVTIGLGFQAQLQTTYLDAGSPTAQGQRKKIPAVTIRMQNSRNIKVGQNQTDGSTLSPMQIAPEWFDLDDVIPQARSLRPYNGTFEPLVSTDARAVLTGGFAKPGQICVQQDNPLPLEVLALIPEDLGGDTPSQEWPQRQKKSA